MRTKQNRQLLHQLLCLVQDPKTAKHFSRELYPKPNRHHRRQDMLMQTNVTVGKLVKHLMVRKALTLNLSQCVAKKIVRMRWPVNRLALSETHLQSQLESTESHQFSEYHCFWGPNSPDRHYGGVALLTKRSSFWHAKKIEWPLEHQCCRFFRDNRLPAVQLWLGTGGVSILVYVVNGMSGARWEASKKTYFHTLFEAIKQDRISRGPIPAVLLGDFNLEITDSYPIRSALQARFWCDTRDKSSADMQLKTTCHKGKLVQKQIIFLSQLA